MAMDGKILIFDKFSGEVLYTIYHPESNLITNDIPIPLFGLTITNYLAVAYDDKSLVIYEHMKGKISKTF